MAGKANDRAEPHRQGDGRQGARACEGFTSALDGRPAPGQAQTAFADPASRTVPTAPKAPHRSVRPGRCRPCWGASRVPITPQQRHSSCLSRPFPWLGAAEKPGSGLLANPGQKPQRLSGSTHHRADQLWPEPPADYPPIWQVQVYERPVVASLL